MKKTIGQRIKERRIELGMTQEELAHKLGNKSRASVCTVEKDKEDLTTTRIKQYAEALECTPSYLMGWEDRNGNPIEPKHKPFPFDPSAYRKDYLKRAVEYYQKISRLSPEHQAELENYLEYLQTRQDPHQTK